MQIRFHFIFRTFSTQIFCPYWVFFDWIWTQICWLPLNWTQYATICNRRGEWNNISCIVRVFFFLFDLCYSFRYFGTFLIPPVFHSDSNDVKPSTGIMNKKKKNIIEPYISLSGHIVFIRLPLNLIRLNKREWNCDKNLPRKYSI